MVGLTGIILYLIMAESDFFIFYLVCAYVVVYALAFFIGCGLLRKLNLLASAQFVAYLAAGVGGNILINILTFKLALISPLLFIPVVLVLLVLLNYALTKGIFKISDREARLIGMLVGLISTLLSTIIGPAFFMLISD
jgi:hypothetical protein